MSNAATPIKKTKTPSAGASGYPFHETMGLGHSLSTSEITQGVRHVHGAQKIRHFERTGSQTRMNSLMGPIAT